MKNNTVPKLGITSKFCSTFSKEKKIFLQLLKEIQKKIFQLLFRKKKRTLFMLDSTSLLTKQFQLVSLGLGQ